MNKFICGNISNPKIYLDEQNLRLIMSYRNLFERLAGSLIDEGKVDSARKVLDRCMEIFPDKVARYDYFVAQLAGCYYRTGDAQKADAICEKVLHLMDQDLDYLFAFPQDELKSMDGSLKEDLMTLQRLGEIVTSGTKKEALKRNTEACFRKNWELYTSKVYQQ